MSERRIPVVNQAESCEGRARSRPKDDADIPRLCVTPPSSNSLRRSALGASSPEARNIATLYHADLDRTIAAVSTVIHLYALEADRSGSPEALDRWTLFDEAHHPLDDTGVWTSVPCTDLVHGFMADIQQRLDLDDRCVVTALVFLERAVFGSGFVIAARTWRIGLLVSLVVASKVVYDEATFLGDFRAHLPWLEAELSQQEAALLALIDFHTVIKSRQYAEYYYALLAVHEQPPKEAVRRQLGFAVVAD